MIDREHPSLSVERQCELLGVSRSGLYTAPGAVRDDEETLMATIDKIYTAWPFYGYRRITAELFKRGTVVNHKRVLRLMRAMNIASIAPGPQTSVPHPQHKKYPYLLRNVPIVRPDQVWCTDITYLPMARGHLFLVAILDWYSRHVLAWRLSNTCDVGFCLEALDEALSLGRTPEIFNSDQGSQFTSVEFVGENIIFFIQHFQPFESFFNIAGSVREQIFKNVKNPVEMGNFFGRIFFERKTFVEI